MSEIMGNANTLDSRDVCLMIGKRHDNLMRDIDGYVESLENSSEISALKIEVSDFFIKSEYVSVRGRTFPCYLITEKGCDFIANKLTGDKGATFTAIYATRFHEMDKRLKSLQVESEQSQLQAPVPTNLMQLEIIESMVGYMKKHELQISEHELRIADLEKEREVKADVIVSDLSSKRRNNPRIAQGLYSTTAIGYSFNMSGKILGKILYDHDILERRGRHNVLSDNYRNKGYDKEALRKAEINGRKVTVIATMAWTQAGAEFVRDLLLGLGYEQHTELNCKVLARQKKTS